jgi:hypothetical protein
MELPPIVSPQEWEAARQALLVEEKELTRARDAMAAKRRRMPWMAVEKDYRFEGPDGPVSLADLFKGRRQLIVYRAFYAPDVTTYPPAGGSYPQRACVGCSLVADQVAHPAHLNARDTMLVFLVHPHRRLRRRLRGRPVARDQRLHSRGRSDLPHVLHRRPRRRADGEHLELPRHHCARAPGGVGGLAGGLSADAALSVVELPRRVRQGDVIAPTGVSLCRAPQSANSPPWTMTA